MNAMLPSRDSSHRVVGVALVVALVSILLQTWWAVNQDYHQTLAAETTNGLIAVRLLDENANQTLKDAMHTLDQVVHKVQHLSSKKTLQADDIRKVIAEHDLSQSRHLKAVQYVSPEGQSWISSPDYPTHARTVAYRNDVYFLQSHPTYRDAVVGRPYASNYDSQWVLPISRTLVDSRDQIIGVIAVDVRLSYFSQLYARVAAENQAAVSLVADDGHVIVRTPFEARFVNRDLSGEPPMATLLRGDREGSFEGEGFLDDDPGANLYTYRRDNDFAITAVYARPIEQVTTAWRERTRGRLALAFAVAALATLLARVLLNYMGRLESSQASLRQSEQRFIILFRQSPVCVIIGRPADGTFIDANDAWIETFGYSLQEMMGRTATQLGFWADPAQRRAYFAHIAHSDALDNFAIDFRTRDGRLVRGLTSSRIVNVDNERILLFTLIDITELRNAQEQIQRMNEELEARVAARTETLAQSNRELEQALKSVKTMQAELVRSEKMAALGSLVAGVAHELNTPIGNSVTVASTLQHQVETLAQEMRTNTMRRSSLQTFVEGAATGTDILLRSLQRADQLIGSFKRVAVDQSSDLRRSFDLATALQEICTTLAPMYRKTQHTLSLELAPGLNMDSFPGALGQCITNFVSNALQHAFEGRAQGAMTLTARIGTPGRVSLVFTDNGIGMTQATLKRVFDPFFTTKLGQGGSGLGMNIVYNIVHEVLGGTIVIDSTPEEGTRITLDLPQRAPSTAGESALAGS